MYVNGKAMPVAASARAIGYSITASGRHTLPAGHSPICK
jgi:hypothetical protein